MASTFRIPKVIVTGENSRKDFVNLPEIASCTKALFITDKINIDANIEAECKQDLEKSGIKLIEYQLSGDLVRSETVDEAAEIARNENVDLVIAIGGRLSMHLGRLVAMLMTNGGKMDQYKTANDISSPSIKCAVMATTASSGVALSACVCYLNSETKKRYCFANPSILPTVAVLDPGLTNWLSPQDIALDGITSIGYAVEALVSDIATPVTDAVAQQAITAMVEWLPELYANSYKIEVREKLMFAQQLVSMSSTNVMANMVCKLAGQIETMTHIPMGNSVAALLPNVIEMLEDIVPEKVHLMGRAIMLGDRTIEYDSETTSGADALRSIIQRLDLPLQLSFLGFEEGHIGKLIETLDEHTLDTTAPIPTDMKSLEDLLRKSL